MNEAHFTEIERAMLCVEHATYRLREAAKKIKKDGAEPHLAAALQDCAISTSCAHLKLMQGTYYHVPTESPA